MLEYNDPESALQVDVEKLREEYPRTLDLYREVCVVMFFRYGITPTANKLYQLVRKGSMSAPTEALRGFWADLRRSGKVQLGQPGLPDDLAQAAGDLVSKLWNSAQAAANGSLEEFRLIAEQERDSALQETRTVQDLLENADRELRVIVDKLEAASRENVTLREQAAVGAATTAEMNAKLTDARRAASEADRRLEVIRTEHAAEIERVTARITQAEERYRSLEQRSLVEIDRERKTVSKLEKAIESERTVSTASLQKLQSELTDMRIEAAKQARDFAALDLDLKNAVNERNIARATAAQLQAKTSDLTGQIAVERARAEVLREQLNRRPPIQTRVAKQGQRGKTFTARRSKTKPAG